MRVFAIICLHFNFYRLHIRLRYFAMRSFHIGLAHILIIIINNKNNLFFHITKLAGRALLLKFYPPSPPYMRTYRNDIRMTNLC